MKKPRFCLQVLGLGLIVSSLLANPSFAVAQSATEAGVNVEIGTLLIIFGVIVASLTVAVAVMIINVRRRAKVEAKLWAYQSNLEMLVASRTESLSREISFREKTEASLRESEERYRRLFEASPAVQVIIDPNDGRILDANGAALAFYGYSEPQMLQKHLTDITAQSAGELQSGIESILDYHDNYFIMQHRLSNQEIRDVEVYATPIVWQGQEVLQSIVIDVTERARLEAELKQLASTDELTGAFNRRKFLEIARKEWQRSRRFNHPLSLIMMDIDHFKSINDTYGHAVGDEALKALVTAVEEGLRDQDELGRLGGEEFGILLIETDAVDAQAVAERLRRTLESMHVVTKGHDIQFTVSCGVTGISIYEEDLSKALIRADQALYRAKRRGRNRVIAS